MSILDGAILLFVSYVVNLYKGLTYDCRRTTMEINPPREVLLHITLEGKTISSS